MWQLPYRIILNANASVTVAQVKNNHKVSKLKSGTQLYSPKVSQHLLTLDYTTSHTKPHKAIAVKPLSVLSWVKLHFIFIKWNFLFTRGRLSYFYSPKSNVVWPEVNKAPLTGLD